LLGTLGYIVVEHTIFVKVIDEVTGKPIPNAKVALFSREARAEAKTAISDADGRCGIPFVFVGGNHVSPVCHIGGVLFRGTNVEIEADGYVPMIKDLGELLAQGWSVHAPSPPPIEIRLSPRK
jgi:hypothetical protein